MSASFRDLSYLKEQQGGSPTASGSPLARGSSLTAGQISRRPSSALTTPKASDLVASSLNNKQADMYISELLSYSLDRMRKEPELLAEERQQVERNMQSSALSHYHAFIDSANCMSVVQQQLAKACDGLDELSREVPDLANSFEAFSKDATAVMAQRNSNKQLLAQQGTILELLDAPQLMDTCVRNGIYDEAFDLHAFIMRVALLHPEMPIVKLLAAQAQAVSQAMLQQLLQRLRTNIQLPECLRVVGYLRRMAAFPEAELRLQFLRCREDWLAQLIAELDDTDSYEYVKHLTDVHRLHLFDIVMQYRAIFFDTSAQETGKPGTFTASSSSIKDGCIMFTWVQHRIMHYLSALQRHLPLVEEGTNLAAVLEHCMYCCSSLSRVGLDFSGMLEPLFQLCILHLFSNKLAVAVDAFHQRLDSHKWVSMPTPLFHQKARQGEAAAAAAAAGSGEEGAAAVGSEKAEQQQQQQQQLTLPYELMEHVPLAVFTNGVLLALNELRHCALLPLQQPAGSLLQGALEQVASSMVHYKHTHNLADSEAQLFLAAARALSDVLVAYVSGCFASIFPGGKRLLNAAAVTGILQNA